MQGLKRPVLKLPMTAAISRIWNTVTVLAIGFLTGRFLGLLLRAVLGF